MTVILPSNRKAIKKSYQIWNVQRFYVQTGFILIHVLLMYQKSGLPITKSQNVICSDSEFKGMWRQFSLVNNFLSYLEMYR